MTDLVDLRASLERALDDRGTLPVLVGLCAEIQGRALALLAIPPAVVAANLVDATEMARILDVPENWVRDKARAGALPCQRLGHYQRFSPAEVLEAVRQGTRLHDSRFRGVKKHTEKRFGARPVSSQCPPSSAPTPSVSAAGDPPAADAPAEGSAGTP